MKNLITMVNTAFSVPGFLILIGDFTPTQLIIAYLAGTCLVWAFLFSMNNLYLNARDTVDAVCTALRCLTWLVFIACIVTHGFSNKYFTVWGYLLVITTWVTYGLKSKKPQYVNPIK